MRGWVALVSTLVVGAVVALAPAASAQEVTTTTILPIFVLLQVSPHSGPAGTQVSVRGGMCDEFRGGEFVTFSFDGVDRNVSVDAQGAWAETVTIPGDAVPGTVFTISALCAKSTSTVFRYADVAFTVAAATPTSAPTTTSTREVSTSTTATTETTVTSPPLVILVDPTIPTTAAPTAELPRTGGNDPAGLAALAGSLIGAGGLLVLSRRRTRRR